MMYHEQGGVCAICGRPPGMRRLAIDHKHGVPGRAGIRGLLCGLENYGLGIFKDDAVRLRRAAEYLERPRPLMD